MNGKKFISVMILAAAFTAGGLAAEAKKPAAAPQKITPEAEVKQRNVEIDKLIKEKKIDEANALRKKIYTDKRFSPKDRTNAFIARAWVIFEANKKNPSKLGEIGDETEKFFFSDGADKKNLHVFTQFLNRCDPPANRGWARIRKLQLIVAKEPEMNPRFRILAAESVADFLRDSEKFAEAEALLRSLTQANMPEANHYHAVAQLANHLACDFRLNEALAELDKLQKKYPDSAGYVTQQKAKLYNMYWEREKACAVLVQSGSPATGAKYLPRAKRIPLFQKYVADEKLHINERRIAYSALLADGSKENFHLLRTYRDVFLNTRGDERRRNMLIKEFVAAASRSASYFNFERTLFMLDLVKEFLISETYQCVFLRAHALNALRRYKEAKTFLEKHKDNPEFKFQERMRLNIMAAFTGPDFPAAMDKILKDFPVGKEMTLKQYSDMLCTTAGYAITAELDEQAKYLHSLYEKLLVPEPRRYYDVKFFDKPVRNISDFQNLSRWSKPEFQAMDRKFGGARDMLYTDVSTGNRILTSNDKEQDFTKIALLCDENAFHLVIEVPCDDPEAVVSKRVGVGSFEIYFAPGFNQPYTCLIPAANDRETQIWSTTYDNARHHRIRENSEDILNDIAVTGKRSYTKMISFNWKSFYNKLPEYGDEWEFECNHWRGARGSWNGLKDLHARDSWGRLRFHLTDAQLRKIKRKIISQALNFYQAEKQTMRVKDGVSQPGVLYHWQDPELGDPEFYKAIVKPYEEKLDAYISLVKTDMSDDDVEKVFSEVVEKWYNIEFDIAEFRGQWVKDRMFRE